MNDCQDYSLFISERLKVVHFPLSLFLPLLPEQLNPEPSEWGGVKQPSTLGGFRRPREERAHAGSLAWCSGACKGKVASKHGRRALWDRALMDWRQGPHRQAAWSRTAEPKAGEEVIHTGEWPRVRTQMGWDSVPWHQNIEVWTKVRKVSNQRRALPGYQSPRGM